MNVVREIDVVSRSTFMGKEIDVYGTADEPLFKAKDVAEWIGVKNVPDLITRVDTEEVHRLNLCGLQGETWFLTEDGLYEVLMQSRKPIAKQFKKGVKTILKEIRKTGKYSSTAQRKPSLNERMSASLTFADWSAKFLNLNDASKLGMAKRIGKMVGLEDTLPMAVNAGTEKPVTHASRDLLLSHGVGISTQAFNKVLEIKGIVKQATRPGRGGKVHKWMVLQPAFDKYGQNQQHPNYQQQTQIRWYDATFAELLTIVGLNKQTSLSMQ